MRNSTTIDIFLASPSDVVPERQIVDAAVSEWNVGRGRQLSVNFDLLKWETHTVPSFSGYPQAAVNEQIGSSFDLLIGIFWARVGSKTPDFLSGTVEEFERALARLEAGEDVKIALYFKNAAVPINDIDTEQIAGVREIIARIRAKGGLYREFSTDEELKANVTLLLDRVAAEADVKALSSNLPVKREANSGQVGLSQSISAHGEEIGLIDAQERMEDAASKLGSFLSKVAITQRKLNETTVDATVRLAELNSTGVTAAAAKAITDRVSAAMDEVTTLYNNGQAEAAESLDEISSMMRAVAIVYSGAGEYMASGREKIAADAFTLYESISGAMDQLFEFQAVVKAVPSLTTKFNVSRRQMLLAFDGFLTELGATQRVLSETIKILRA